MYLDDENSALWNLENFDLGPASGGWTIDIANDQFWDDRGFYRGAQPSPKFNKPGNRPPSSALPFGVSYETFRNPGPRVTLSLEGDATVPGRSALWLDPLVGRRGEPGRLPARRRQRGPGR